MKLLMINRIFWIFHSNFSENSNIIQSTEAQNDPTLRDNFNNENEKTADPDNPEDPKFTERINSFEFLFQHNLLMVDWNLSIQNKSVFNDMRIQAEVSGMALPLEKLDLNEGYVS